MQSIFLIYENSNLPMFTKTNVRDLSMVRHRSMIYVWYQVWEWVSQGKEYGWCILYAVMMFRASQQIFTWDFVTLDAVALKIFCDRLKHWVFSKVTITNLLGI